MSHPIPTTDDGKQRAIWDRHDDGIPPIRATKPGDELKSTTRHKTEEKATVIEEQIADPGKTTDVAVAPSEAEAESVASSSLEAKTALPASLISNISTPTKSMINDRRRRLFHLSHTVASSVLKPINPSPIKKTKNYIRPPLPTFEERHTPRFSSGSPLIHKNLPVDKIIALAQTKDSSAVNSIDKHDQIPDAESPRIRVESFLKPRAPAVKLGQTTKDHPSTWDLQSDQLADELAAWAFEVDPVETKSPSPPVSSQQDEVMDVDKVDEYVYETYLRVRQDGENPVALATKNPDEIGVLVIESDDEELWETYMASDDDTDWDEEDADSNGGCFNMFIHLKAC